MKIIHIITDLNKGGAEFALFRLLKFASENDNLNNHIVVSLTPNGYFENEIEKIGYLVISLDFNKNKFKNCIKLFKIIKKEKPNIIQTWMYHSDLLGGVIGRLLNIKKIYWGIHHSNLSFKANKTTTYFLFKLLSILSYFVPHKIIACSKISIKVHKALGYKDLFIYCPLGYDFSEFDFNQEKRKNLRNSWKVDNNDFLAGIVSRWDSQKDIHNLISAISIVQKNNNSIKYVIVGKNLDFENIDFANLLNKFNLDKSKLIILGQSNDVQSIYSAIDLLMLSSRGEAFPNVLAEAMLCERNCLSTNVGDVPQILSTNNLIVEKENSQEFANGIISAYNLWKNNTFDYYSNGKENRNYIKNNFSISNMYKNYVIAWNLS